MLRVLFTVGIVLAGVACCSLLLLKLSLGWQEGSFYQIIGGISYGQITTSIFLKVAVSDFLTLFAPARGSSGFGLPPCSHPPICRGIPLGCSTILACCWPCHDQTAYLLLARAEAPTCYRCSSGPTASRGGSCAQPR